jgi:hypothetical protein
VVVAAAVAVAAAAAAAAGKSCDPERNLRFCSTITVGDGVDAPSPFSLVASLDCRHPRQSSARRRFAREGNASRDVTFPQTPYPRADRAARSIR